MDPRRHPLIELDRRTVETLLAPLAGSAGVREIEPVDGGLVNTVLRITTEAGDALALRVYAGGRAGFDRECRLLPRLAGELPVPDVLFADDGVSGGVPPYLVYRWIEGITLNECRRRLPHAIEVLAEPLGRLLARVAANIPVDDLREISIAKRLAVADEQLRDGLARARLGGAVADRLRALLAEGAPELEALDHAPGLVHGDVGGRNILVREGGNGGWEPSGVVDWETAGAGAVLWDVGSLFRYPRRYSPAFRDAFARGYRAGGGTLPRDWWWLARLLDSTRQVATLSEDRELPTVFADCRELIETLVAMQSGRARPTGAETG
jgi:aminoglycoside phosphotransferase (APT) family kinase protein